MKKGFARDLAGFWTAPRDEQKQTRDRPIDLLDSAATGPTICESVPQQCPEGVYRANDAGADETIDIEPGRARNMASKWQNRQDEPQTKQPFRLEMDVDKHAGGCTI